MLSLNTKGLLNGRVRGRSLTIMVCFAASSGFFLLGYDQGVMSGTITEPIFLHIFPGMEPKNKSGAIQALVVAIYEIGCLIGAGGIIAFGDKIRRRAWLGTEYFIAACVTLLVVDRFRRRNLMMENLSISLQSVSFHTGT
ncbi:hypothetical protein DPSP01_000216 [Paraphaeosphaeria sporulosa]